MTPTELRQAIAELSDEAQREVAFSVVSLRIPYELVPDGMRVDLESLSEQQRADLAAVLPTLRSADDGPSHSPPASRGAVALSGRSAFNAMVKRLSRPSGFGAAPSG